MDVPDAQLVERARQGDRDAFAAIYDRYADRIHSFCAQSLRDRDDAADATQDTFCKAAQRLEQLRDPSRLRAWLFAIARNETANRGRARARTVVHDDFSDLEAAVVDPVAGLTGAELQALVWAAADSLNERDRQLLDLQMREELDGPEMAEVMEVEPAHLHVLVSRMRDRMEKALGTLLVARQGRDDCPDLDRVLAGWDGHFTMDVRARVTRHVEGCDICDERRRGAAVLPMLSPAIFVIPAPATLRNRVLAAADPLLPVAAKAVNWGRRLAIAVAAAAAVLLVGLPLLLALREDSRTLPAAVELPSTSTVPAAASTTPPATITTAAPSTTIPATTAPPSTTSPPPPTTVPETVAPVPAAPAAWSLATSTVDFGAETVTSPVTLSNTGATAGTWTATTDAPAFSVVPSTGTLDPGQSVELSVTVDRTGLAEQTLNGTLTVSGESSSATATLTARIETPPVLDRVVVTPPTACVEGSARITTVTVQALATDDTGVALVTVSWSAGSLTLDPLGNNLFGGQAGPFPTAGTETLTLTATDARGNTVTAAASIDVRVC